MSKIKTKICVFDSGVGGLSTLEGLRQTLPDVEFIYCADYAFFPYGLKTKEALEERIPKVISFLYKTCHFDLVVVACNTASTHALEEIRKALPIPVVGLVPAVKSAAAMTKSGVIGILATYRTVEGGYLQDLISKFAHTCRHVVLCPSRVLVDMAEKKLHGLDFKKYLPDLEKELAVFHSHQDMDVVVLGCTHFSFLQDELHSYFAHNMTLIDSTDGVVRRVCDLLSMTPQQDDCLRAPKNSTLFLSTQDFNFSLKTKKNWAKRFGCYDFKVIEICND